MTNEEDRLYFIIRSFVMGQISVLLFFLSALILGSINALQTVIIGILVFVASLIISRLFEPIITLAVTWGAGMLRRHRKLRGFILKHF